MRRDLVLACVVAGCAGAPEPTRTPVPSGRHYELHLPSHRPPGRYPLVLALHGGFGNGAVLERAIGLDAIADREGFAVVYPDGLNRHWNDGRGSASGATDVDDVAYLRSLVDELTAAYPIDVDRVYATGMSNGGIMSYRLGCELADKLAAIAIVSGEISATVAASCHPARAISVLAINGTADPFVPWDGGQVGGRGMGRGEVIGARRSIAMFGAAAHCNPEPTTTAEPDRDPDDGTTVQDIVFRDCAPGAAIELLEIDGGGHSWPGGVKNLGRRLGGVTSRELSASQRIWQFFAEHPRR
jgi:polyhydroxybutyrate depolymerase